MIRIDDSGRATFIQQDGLLEMTDALGNVSGGGVDDDGRFTADVATDGVRWRCDLHVEADERFQGPAPSP